MEQIEQKPHSGPKDFFMHLLAFGTLYASAISLIQLWFAYINIKFPDPLNNPYYGGYQSSGFDTLRWPIAILIVVFPVFLILARWISKQIAYDPARKELRIYKWLVYLTLFVSAVTVIIDLITLIYNFLGGELTVRFGLKVLVVLIVALAVFGYYLWHLRTDLSKYKTKGSILMWIAPIAIAISILLSFVVVGSPASARDRRMDEQMVQNLQIVQSQVIQFWQAKDVLPTQKQAEQFSPAGVTYMSTGPLMFQLCADFKTAGYPTGMQPYYPTGISGNDDWDHGMGHVCFDRTIDPDFYPKPALPMGL